MDIKVILKSQSEELLSSLCDSIGYDPNKWSESAVDGLLGEILMVLSVQRETPIIPVQTLIESYAECGVDECEIRFWISMQKASAAVLEAILLIGCGHEPFETELPEGV